ncbi:MAG TPA: hypothetical protein VLB27_05080, partial [candidate division Zixibacteria bacterium]|nr:hypothetical protein [candidate division Zixibacteria bacterium]
MTIDPKTLATLRHTRRPVRLVELWRCDDWTVKLYGIRQGAVAPDPEYIDRAKELARGVLPQPAHTSERY